MPEDLSFFDILPYLMIGGFIYFILRSVMQFKVLMSSIGTFTQMPGQHETPEFLASKLRDDGLENEADNFMRYVRDDAESMADKTADDLNISVTENAQSMREKIALVQKIYIAQQRDRFTDIDRTVDFLKNLKSSHGSIITSATRDLIDKYIYLLTHRSEPLYVADDQIRKKKKDVL